MCHFEKSTEETLEVVERFDRTAIFKEAKFSQRLSGRSQSSSLDKRMNVSGFTTLYAFPNSFVFEQISDLMKREIIPRDQASL